MADRGHILFVTGKLAAPSLEPVVHCLATEIGFEARIHVAKISVAALMTADWLAGKLFPPDGTTRVILPGLCRGDLELLRASYPTISFERGPENLLDLPEFFKRGTSSVPPYGGYDIEILAEINHSDQLSREELLQVARQLTASGGDIIDLGCTPGEPWIEIGDAVHALREEGMRVSVDSFHSQEVEDAIAAGAELVLSVNGSNIERALDWGAEVVLIPDDHQADGWLDELMLNAERLTSAHIRFRVDPILDPLGFGFAASMGRYLEVRRAMPQVEMMLGIGNLTELTEVDSAGVNTLLVGFCQEVGIRSVLTTEVINWARSSTSEIDLARRLMISINNRRLPKHVDSRLVMLRDPKIHQRSVTELRQLQERIRDPNFRLFAENGQVFAMNNTLFESDADPFHLFDRLGVEDASHAFYLGWEMMKASLAIQLGKNYIQDRALRWGFLTREEMSHRESHAPQNDLQQDNTEPANDPRRYRYYPKRGRFDQRGAHGPGSLRR